MAVKKSVGTTASERYLARLCENTFLSLWSYPNVFRDQGTKGENGVGKEICDLLVVCGNDVIIFSDKSCEYPDTGNEHTDWCRWYKKAIQKSAAQLFGAERWLRKYPSRVFIDEKCTQPLPIPFENPKDCRFHRVAVALGVKERSRKLFRGRSSGSLMLMPTIVGNMHTSDHAIPCCLGRIETSKGLVHVFDDVTLDVVLRELDTITDFVDYLTCKESLIESGKLLSATGEEDLLAAYLWDIGPDGKHCFPSPDGFDSISQCLDASEREKPTRSAIFGTKSSMSSVGMH